MILDTNAVSALAENDPHLIALLETEPIHHLAAIVLGEYRYGLIRSRHRQRIGAWLDQLEGEMVVLSVDVNTACFYADAREQLRQIGKPIPVNDLWIAALALQHELPLISRDAHFDAVDGLRRLAW